jgi:1-deoxy-D-xylulose-5-phosphate reductoisomerase
MVVNARSVSIVGSTGSIGTQAIDVVGSSEAELRVLAIGANRSVDALAAQATALRPEVVALADAALAPSLAPRLPKGTDLVAGPDALRSIASVGDVVLNAVVGFAGLPVTVAALESGRRLALANKESLIAGAPVVQAARSTRGAEIVPVDSEHCAVHQCLGERARADIAAAVAAGAGPACPPAVSRIVLTASGGPFRGRSLEQLQDVTVAEALAHPTWNMGPKITVDSSTLMNKGLEVIEAHELFGVDYDRIEVVIHPQSIIHSMVEFTDGATLAQLSYPDMRLPIGYSLAYPDRFGRPFGALDWRQLRALEFEEPDLAVFSCLSLAYRAGREGGSAPAWLNAANEVAVEAFLAGRLGWPAISDVVAETLDSHDGAKLVDPGDVLEADRAARERARSAVERRSSR